jgi:GT2 family glycosyltransferase
MLPNLTVPVLNRYDLLERMVSSIDYPVKHLLIIDNGASTVMEDISIDVPDCVEHTTYLPMPANLGVAGSWNLGIKSFPYADRWFIASNDVQFEPGALERLSEARRDEITLSGDFPFWQAFCVGYEAVRRLGLFDEAFFPAYFEDNDYRRRADHAG